MTESTHNAEYVRRDDAIRTILVCGSRTYPEADEMVEYVLEGIKEMHSCANQQPTVIEGGARGADRAASDWVQGFGTEYPYPHKRFPAEWAKDGKAAGPIRNARMLAQGPDIVVAFVDKPLAESRGTADMVRKAVAAGVPTYVIQRMGTHIDGYVGNS